MSDWNGDKDYLARKGLTAQREKPTASKVKPVLLEYEVKEHETGWIHRKAGWRKHGRYKSEAQALRVIEQLQSLRGTSPWSQAPPAGCRWRINGELVEATVS